MIEQLIQGNVLRAQDGDENAARALEEHVEQHGLQVKYTAELVEILNIYGDRTWYDWDSDWPDAVWDCMRATPEQRCRAFLEAVKE